MSDKTGPNPNADKLRDIFEKAGAIEDVGYAPAAKKPQQVPSVGRVVHVVTFSGQHRPADILDPQDGKHICLLVKVKPADLIREGVQHNTVLWYLEDAPYDPTAQQPGSWHWPEFVPPA